MFPFAKWHGLQASIKNHGRWEEKQWAQGLQQCRYQLVIGKYFLISSGLAGQNSQGNCAVLILEALSMAENKEEISTSF